MKTTDRGKMMKTFLITLYLFPPLAMGTGDRNTTTCRIKVEKQTILICTFPDNVKTLKMNIKVVHFISGSESKEDVILFCTWNNTKECIVKEEYEFDGNVTDTLQIYFRHNSKELSGRYVCFLIPVAADSYEMCTFKDATLKSLNTTMFAEDLITTSQENVIGVAGHESYYGPFLIVLVLFLVVIAFGVVVCVICYKRCFKAKRRNVRQTAREETGLVTPSWKEIGLVTPSWKEIGLVTPACEEMQLVTPASEEMQLVTPACEDRGLATPPCNIGN